MKLFVLLLALSPAYGYQLPQTARQLQRQVAADQRLSEIAVLLGKIRKQIETLTQSGRYHPVETLAWQDIQDPQILQWKKTIAAKYQDAIYATIEAYDIAPNTNGIPTGSLNMQTGPFKNNAVAWRPVYAAIGIRNITLPDGSTYTWPDADPTKAKKFIGEARIIKDGVTTADGTTVIAGFRQNAFLFRNCCCMSTPTSNYFRKRNGMIGRRGATGKAKSWTGSRRRSRRSPGAIPKRKFGNGSSWTIL